MECQLSGYFNVAKCTHNTHKHMNIMLHHVEFLEGPSLARISSSRRFSSSLSLEESGYFCLILTLSCVGGTHTHCHMDTHTHAHMTHTLSSLSS